MFRNKFCKSSKAAKQQPVFKQDYIENCHRTYSCIHCRAHLADHDELISKLFQGNHGRAYLFNKVVNIGCKQAVQRELLTGLHAVADIYCDCCQTTLGWKYEQAFVPSQKYKEGKYIIELVHMLKENDWDLTSYNVKEMMKETYAKNLDMNKKLASPSIVNNFYVGYGNYKSDINSELTREVDLIITQQTSRDEIQVIPSVDRNSESNENIAPIRIDTISNGIEMMKIDLQSTRTS